MQSLALLVFAVTALCSKIQLPSYPLAVKNPYLSTWFPGGDSGPFNSQCPQFWAGQELTWTVLARVNNKTYSLFGCPHDGIPAAEQVDREFTSTTTKVTMKAGPTEFLLDFFSPVSLTDYVRQSIPYSYLTVTVNDAPRMARIDILTTIDDSWTAQNNTQADFIDGDNSSIFTISGVDSIPRSESKDMATYGQVVLAADKRSQDHEVTFQAGSSSDIHSAFADEGALSSDKTYSSGNLVAFAYRLLNPAQSPSVSFAIGFERDDVVIWLDELQTGYYQSELSGTEETVDHFFADEKDAREEGAELDAKVQSLGDKVSQNYTDVLEASVRQIWGDAELTIPKDTKDTSKAKAFIKEISTDGNAQTLADLIPKVLPAFYLLAPEYIRLMCEPVMEYTLQWPATYAFHDLGKHYPNVTGETVADQEPLIMDQTSVIHWMAYSYQKASGNTDWIKPYVKPMQNYADHLVKNGLYPPSERSSVDSIQASPNQTVLAIYAAIGMNAFGEMTGMTNYSDTAKEYAEKILDLGFDSKRTHLRAHYNDTDDSWITAYPFGFDKMLDLNTFNESTYKLLSDFYETKLHPYGMVLDDRVDYIVAELAMWTTGTTSNKVRDGIIDGIHGALVNPLNTFPGPTQWNVTGNDPGLAFFSIAKPIVGGYFMPAIIHGE